MSISLYYNAKRANASESIFSGSLGLPYDPEKAIEIFT